MAGLFQRFFKPKSADTAQNSSTTSASPPTSSPSQESKVAPAPKPTEPKPPQAGGVTPAPRPAKKGSAFFLDPDDAKTLGNIEYMRTPKVVRKTFSTLGGTQAGFETIEQISATEKVELSESPKPARSASESAESVAAPERRRASSDMDTFRNMARDLKKS